jgi:two-component system, OmpR family, phosphate regulon response regulator PhoB
VTSVLLVDDERDLLSVVDFNLRAAGLETLLATTGEQALSLIRRRIPDLVLLDLMLPDMSGTEVCRRIKSDPRTKHVPVVMLTAKGEEVDRVVGFELGADDYVTKPFSVRELVLRVKAVLRRSGPGKTSERPPEKVGPIRVDVVQSREQLLEDVWEMSSEVETRTVDTHVKRLREKLGSGRDLLETVRGIGYRLVDPSDRT